VAETRRNAVVIVVTHDLMLAARFASKVLLMHQGSLVAEGAPDEVLTAGRLRDVYGVAVKEIAVDGWRLTLPWSAA
jgi:iron complex transport system ATP-binding protein